MKQMASVQNFFVFACTRNRFYQCVLFRRLRNSGILVCVSRAENQSLKSGVRTMHSSEHENVREHDTVREEDLVDGDVLPPSQKKLDICDTTRARKI